MRTHRLAAAVALVAAAATGCTQPRPVSGTAAPLTASATPSRPPPATTPSGTARLPTSYVVQTLEGEGVTVRVPVPAGWSLVPTTHGVDLGDASGRLLLRLEIRPRTPGVSAARAWEIAEPENTKKLRDYRRLAITPVPGVGESAADWTFTFEREVTRRVVDRAVAVGGASVAIYFSAEQRLYEQMLPVFRTATAGLVIIEE